jgi:hypothetical protein
MISKYCAKIINVWDFSDPIVEVMHSEFSGPSLPSIERRVFYEKFVKKKKNDNIKVIIDLLIDFSNFKG